MGTRTTKWGCPGFVCHSTRWNSNIPKLSTQKKNKKNNCWEHNSGLIHLIILRLKYWQI
jgi:hypothetical protein